MSNKVLLLSAAAVAVGFILRSSEVAAAAEVDAGAAPAGLEEITVTARKRNESFLDVPVIATVLSQETLSETKTDGLYALAAHVPSLLLGDSVNSTGTQLSLRGVGTMALNATMDQSVLLDVDGVPMSQSLAYATAMFDVGQVEVFKGPQALFFGKNSTAGVISLRSADPTDKVERIASAGYENNAEEKQFDLIFSGPVTDTLKLRLATRYDDGEGFFRNVAVATPGLGGVTPTYDNLAPNRDVIVRGTALWQPNDLLTARVKLNYDDYRIQAGSPLQVAYCPDGTAGVPPLNIGFIAGDDCRLDRNFRVPWFDPKAFPGTLLNGGVPVTSRIQDFGSVDLNYKVSPDLTLSSVTGFYGIHFDTLQPGSTTGTTQTLSSIIGFRNRQFTQEVRLASSFTDSPVNFMTGAFFNDGHMVNDVLVGGNTILGLPAVIQHPHFTVDNRSYSLFAQAMWDITKKLELAAGARWTDEKRSMTETNLGPAQGPIGPVSRPDPDISSSNVSPEVTLTYKATDTLTTYASYKTGYKSGSFNTISFVPSTQPASFHDEKAKGGELGVKTRTEDHRLTAEIAAYYYKYDGLQVGALELSNYQGGVPAPFLRTINAASATVKGVDFDVAYVPPIVSGLTLNGAVNYNHARYSSFPNAPCGNGQTIAMGCDQLLNPVSGRYTSQDLSGRPLVRAPDWSASLGFQQAVAFANDMSLSFGGGANFVDSYYTIVPDLPGFVQKSYVKVDANIALHGGDDKWEVAVIGRNLNDRITTGWCANTNLQNSVFGGQIAGAATNGPAGQDEAACFADRGREVWARVTLKF
jgi:iron complex outermembrane receptor protein